jgi:hypothetical protein
LRPALNENRNKIIEVLKEGIRQWLIIIKN